MYFAIELTLREISYVLYARAHVRALVTQKSCAVGMRNAKLGNHLKGPVIRATFFFNLSRNIVTLQVETHCCAYYHAVTNLSRNKIHCCRSAEFYTYSRV